MNQWCKYKRNNYKTLRTKHRGKSSWPPRFDNGFLAVTPKAQATKEKNRLIEFHHNVKLLFIKGHIKKVKR